MKMHKNIILFGSMIFLLSGCAKFNPNVGTVAFVDSKPYRVPYEADFGWPPISYQFTPKLATICKPESEPIIWIEGTESDSKMKPLNRLFRQQFSSAKQTFSSDVKKTLSELDEIIYNLTFEQKAGCRYPLSEMEYRHYSGQETQQRGMQHEQKLQNQQNMNETLDRINDTYNANTPKTNNVFIY
jgi:hypothetical protein